MARHCFICLHGKLEGQLQGVEDEVIKQKQEDTDLPNPVEMKELGYLLPGGCEFRRLGADFDKDNIAAEWLRSVNEEVYDEVVKGMVADQNYSLSQGADEKLQDHDEDAKDRDVLSRLFTMSEEQQADVERKLGQLGEWCEGQERRLVSVMPEPRPRGKLPEVPDPTPLQKRLLDYHPLIDTSSFKGASALDAKEALALAEAAISKKGGIDGCRVEDLPRPATAPDMPEVEVVPYPLTVQDLPHYAPLEPLQPERWPIDTSPDPFQRPFLHLEHFHETVMPEFKTTTAWGEPRAVPPQAANMEWLWKTQSLFAEQRGADDKEYDWGMSEPRQRYMVPLIDEPYLPDPDVVRGDGGSKELVNRGIWDPELFVQAPDARAPSMVPPLRERSKELYQPAPFEHPDEPLWSRGLAPPKSRDGKIKEMINVLPVQSFSKFKPSRVSVDLPDFLWDIVRQDAAGQGLWNVIEQRHEIPREVLLERRAADEALQRARDDEREAVETAMAAEMALHSASAAASSSSAPVAGQESTAALAGANVTLYPSVGQGAGAYLPATEVEAPEAPGLPPAPAAIEAKGISAQASAAAAAAAVPASAEAGASPATAVAAAATLPAVAAGAPAVAGTSSPAAASAAAVPAALVPAKQAPAAGGKKVEDILRDDSFIDTIADRIASRLGGTMGGSFGAGGVPSSLAASSSNWREALASGATTLPGHPTTSIVRPDPPSFAEPADELSRAKLPRALMGNNAAKKQDGTQANAGKEAATVSDIMYFTQEKMRGECYVRLLVAPEAHLARKEPVVYQGNSIQPDTTLVTGGASRIYTSMPKKPPRMNEDGEWEEDDEYAAFERNDSVIFSFVRHNRFEAVEALIAQDAEVLSAKDEKGNNLLHIACQNNNRRIVKLLIKSGMEVNEQNNKGNTPLHYCSQYGFMQLADYLLATGADDTIPNDAGLLPPQGLGTATDDVTGAQKTMQADLRQPR